MQKNAAVILAALWLGVTMVDGFAPISFGKLLSRVAPSRTQLKRTSLCAMNADENDMWGPRIIFPPKPWAWERADPKTSLHNFVENPAPAWMLNIIEFAHWVSFPIGFHIAFYLFANASTLAIGVGGNTTGIFLIMLGILNQVFGGGMAVLMHIYEGWMVAPFRNPLILPEQSTAEQIEAIRVQNYNNAWLRAAAYQMLMSFQSFGLGLFTMGVFGVKRWTLALVLGTVLIALVGPKEPRIPLCANKNSQKLSVPVLPLSWSLLFALVANVLCQLLACIKLFYPALHHAWPVPVLAFIASVLPSSLQGAGGAYEGYVAESSFKQSDHLVAFVILLAGFVLLDVEFHKLAAFNLLGIAPPPVPVIGWLLDML